MTKKGYIKNRDFPQLYNKSTFNKQKKLNDRMNLMIGKKKGDVKGSVLKEIVYYSGFSNSIKEAKHMILTNNILVNNSYILEPNYKLKSGDIIKCISNKVLVSYYIQKWNMIKLNEKGRKWKKSRTFTQYKYMINPSLKNLQKLSYNTILFI